MASSGVKRENALVGGVGVSRCSEKNLPWSGACWSFGRLQHNTATLSRERSSTGSGARRVAELQRSTETSPVRNLQQEEMWSYELARMKSVPQLPLI